MKQQKDGWLDAVRELILRTSTLASFHRFSIRDSSFLIVSDLNGGESRLGLNYPAGLDCQLDGW